MKPDRAERNLFKIHEIVLVLSIFFFYVVLISLTTSNIDTHSLFDGLTYPVYVHFLLIPAFMFFLGQHDSYVIHLYCWVRYGSPRKAYRHRLRILLVETLLFLIPYMFILGMFSVVTKAGLSPLLLLLIGLNIFIYLFMLGVCFCALSVRFRRSFYGFIPLLLLLSVDYMISINTFQFIECELSLFYWPMLKPFLAETTGEILHHTVISFIKLIFFTGISFLLFHTGQRSVSTNV